MEATETAQNQTEATSQEATTETTATAADPVVTEQLNLLGEKTETKAEEPAKVEGAPEKYEFKAPEGTEIDSGVSDAFAAVAKELNLTQESAQKVVDQVIPVIQARQQAQVQAIQKGWEDASRIDKEFGGEKLTENLAVAKKALDQFATPELKQLLNTSGLGSNPEVIRLLYRAGKAISEDSFVVGGKESSAADGAKSFYPNSKMT